MKGEKLNLNKDNNGIEGPLVEAIAEEDAAQSDLDLGLDDYPEDVDPTPIFEELYLLPCSPTMMLYLRNLLNVL